MRSKHTTLLVCLALLMSAVFIGTAWADQTESVKEKSINKSHESTKGQNVKAAARLKAPVFLPGCPCPFAREIVKVRAENVPTYLTPALPGYSLLPVTQTGRWDISAGVLYARLRGQIAWPRYSWWGAAWWGGSNSADFTNDLQLPGHIAVPTWNVTYRFRPNWAVRYSGLGFEAKGGGQPSGYFVFGPTQQSYGYYGYGANIQSKYQRGYHRLGLSYDAVKNYRSSVKIFAEWVHAEDRISVSSSIYGQQNTVFSKSTDAAISGIEFRRLMKTAANGAVLSCECKIGAIFLDDIEGWDAQAGAQYTIPLNQGRSGYVKGGYRLLALKKSQNDFLLNPTLEGGFMEFGFVF